MLVATPHNLAAWATREPGFMRPCCTQYICYFYTIILSFKLVTKHGHILYCLCRYL